MNIADLTALSPFIILAATAVVVMLTIAFYRSHKLTVILTLSGLALSAASLSFVSCMLPRAVTPLLMIDQYALFLYRTYRGGKLCRGRPFILLSGDATGPQRGILSPADHRHARLLRARRGEPLCLVLPRHRTFERLALCPRGLSQAQRPRCRGRHQVPHPGRGLVGIHPFRHGTRVRRDRQHGIQQYRCLRSRFQALTV